MSLRKSNEISVYEMQIYWKKPDNLKLLKIAEDRKSLRGYPI